MLTTVEVVQLLQACTSLSDVSTLREELLEELDPEQHCLFFARTAHFIGQETHSIDHNAGMLTL